MAKKDLASVTTDLSTLAALLPTQRPAAPRLVEVAPAKSAPLAQISLSLRQDLRKQLNRLAAEADMTLRAFVLKALQDKGLSVREEDLYDLRKKRR